MTETLERRSRPPGSAGRDQRPEPFAFLDLGLSRYPGRPSPEPLSRPRAALPAETRGLPPRLVTHALIAYAMIGLAVVAGLSRTLDVAQEPTALGGTGTGVAAGQRGAAYQAVKGPPARRGGGPASEPDAAVPGAAVTLLTLRELDVLKLVAQGLTNSDIARQLVLSQHTVHRHLANILRKLSLSSRAGAVAWGVRAGLV
jgi:DNA-binding CsgD family transcriptional regulator